MAIMQRITTASRSALKLTTYIMTMVVNNNKPKSISLNKRLGKLISFLHLWLGLAAGTILLIVAVTGCILAFEDELTPMIYTHEQKLEAIGNRLSIDSLVYLAKAAYPEKKIFRIYLPADQNRSVKTTFGTKKKGYDYLFLNPYSGKILSKGKENKRFFPVVLNIHRFLLAGNTGKIITGISCAITFFMALSGLYLWWPAKRNVLKQRLKIKTDGSGKRLNWDLHAVGGFYIMPFLLIITLTGLIWSYSLIEDLMFKLFDGKKEKTELVKETNGQIKKQSGLYEKVVMATNKIYPGEGELMITFPDKKGKPFTVSKEQSESSFHVVNQLYLDSRNASIIKVVPFKTLTTGAKVRKLNKSIHTGSIFGWPTKTIAFLTSLLTASLPITGFLIWWRRGKKKKNSKSL